jgi:hypothetical protein
MSSESLFIQIINSLKLFLKTESYLYNLFLKVIMALLKNYVFRDNTLSKQRGDLAKTTF